MVLYHGTPKKNVFSIMKEGLKEGIDGGVYLCETIEDALQFMALKRYQTGETIFAVIPVYLDENDKVYAAEDHNSRIIKVKAYYHDGSIPAEKVEQDLSNIPLYGFHVS